MRDMILFDLDGTLWDGADSIAASWNTTLQALDRPERITADQMRQSMGLTIEVIFERLLPNVAPADRPPIWEQCCADENDYIRQHGGTLMPQLEEVLQALSAHYDLGIVSNCQGGYIEAFLAFSGLDRYFADTECHGNTGLSKAENIRLLLERHGNPRAIYVGDTQGDCDAADAAGVPFVYAAYGYATVNRSVPTLTAIAELPSRAESLLCGVPFYPADILLPVGGWEKWGTIACDQFTSEPEYWENADAFVGDAPSALRVVFPEVYLENEPEKRIAEINRTMTAYLQNGQFSEYKDAMIYVERTLPDGRVRHGLVGAIDLEYYAFEKDDTAAIRATEGMVASRIPPRVAIRQDAPMELPHVQLLIDDEKQTVIEPLKDAALPLLYDFELMLGGGHIRGYLVPRERQTVILNALGALTDKDNPLLFAVGDGNHSLITAKTCYQQDPTPYNRYALVEVVNIHDESMEFEPIYRVMFGVDASALLAEMQAAFDAEDGSEPPQEIEWFTATDSGKLTIPHPIRHLTIGTIQAFIDAYLPSHPEVTVDYIHGVESTKTLAKQENAVGFLTDGIAVGDLFPAIRTDGVLPRKTFSIGEAVSKRYYIEGRKIR
ncbi:MAG: HAD-IA family hydrolase [Clostridia bacterium]|nr:HAD-IA family hydrolase [Clostridia bacterium]